MPCDLKCSRKRFRGDSNTPYKKLNHESLPRVPPTFQGVLLPFKGHSKAGKGPFSRISIHSGNLLLIHLLPKSLGIHLLLYGMTCSSLTYLEPFPIDSLEKLDTKHVACVFLKIYVPTCGNLPG